MTNAEFNHAFSARLEQQRDRGPPDVDFIVIFLKHVVKKIVVHSTGSIKKEIYNA